MLSRIEADEKKLELRFSTFNIACLPILKWGVWPFVYEKQINDDTLRANLTRASEIADRYIALNETAEPSPDILGFQEAFDPAVRELLIKKLSPIYPYHTDAKDQKDYEWRPAGSGLLTLSKYEIVEVSYKPFSKQLPGEENAAAKGSLKIRFIWENEYITHINTHLPAGGVVAKDIVTKILGTTSAIRAEAMAEIISHMKMPWKQMNRPGIRDEGTLILSGDFNSKLNDEESRNQISKGLSANGYKEGEKKYDGKPAALFNLFKFNVPRNFLETRKIPPILDPWIKRDGTEKVSKVDDYEKMQVAKEKGFFRGSSIAGKTLKKFKEHPFPLTPFETEPKVIDGIFVNKEFEGELDTNLVAFNTASKVVSDHHAVFGVLKKASRQLFFQSTVKCDIEVDDSGKCKLSLNIRS